MPYQTHLLTCLFSVYRPVFEQEGQRRDQQNFTVRNNVLGHLQQVMVSCCLAIYT